MYQQTLGDFNITLPPGLVQTNVSPDAASAASIASIQEIMRSPVVWILVGLLAVVVLKGKR